MSPDVVTERDLIEAIRRVPEEHRGELLSHIVQFSQRPNTANVGNCWTATDLMALAPDARDAILSAQAAAEKSLYADPELTAFEAFGERDLYVENSDA
jgi:hypothetical protein